jgi:uridine kinase
MEASKVLVIGVAGGTGSGKTTISKALLERFKASNKTAEMLTMDSYYRNLPHLSFAEREKTNFDHPSALETDLLIKHIKDLKSGIAVDVPVYNFEEHQRDSTSTHVNPPDVLVLEGILLFVDSKLREQIDIKVFVETSADIRFIRRLQRDIIERGRSVDHVCAQYLNTVRVMHDEFVEPSKIHADIVVPNYKEDDYNVVVDLLACRAIASNGQISRNSKRLKN